jgi:hypothetical protein
MAAGKKNIKNTSWWWNNGKEARGAEGSRQSPAEFLPFFFLLLTP